MDSLMVQAARFYTDRLSWALVPIEPGSKGPRRPGWNLEKNVITAPEAAGEFWSAHPEHGMGLVHEFSGTATVDADAATTWIATAMEAVGVDYEQLLAAPGSQLQGNPEKPPKLIYRLPVGLQLHRRALRWPNPDKPEEMRVIFELRAGTVQDVLPPSIHPDTHEPYRWRGTGCPRCPEDVPVIPDSLLGLWLEWPDRLRAMESSCPWWTPSPPSPPRTPSRPRRPGEPSVIELWNAAVPVAVMLQRAGYRQSHGRWIPPSSTTGTPGLVLLEGRAYSHHGSDPLGDGRAHDSFDLLRILEHDGDVQAAVRAAARELGISGQMQRQREKAVRYPDARRQRYQRNRRVLQ